MPLLPPIPARVVRQLLTHPQPSFFVRILRGLLSLAEKPYVSVVRRRNRRFDTGRTAIQCASVPVVSVGNLTVGGTGKTPMVEWLAQWFLDQHLRVVLVSRGYGARAGQQNDEALELAERLPNVPHVQNADRVAAARSAIDQHGAQVLLLDDAFQHRRLHRDLDIVLLDASDPFGGGRCLPRGFLREPVAGLARAHVVCLSRSDLVDESRRNEIQREVRQLAPHAAWVEISNLPQFLLAADGSRGEISDFVGAEIVGFCGLGNPDGFRRTLRDCGLRTIDFHEFPDHHPYGERDVDMLTKWCERMNVEAALCTHKDLVKLRRTHLGDCPLYAVSIGLHVGRGKELLEQRLAPIARHAADNEPQDKP